MGKTKYFEKKRALNGQFPVYFCPKFKMDDPARIMPLNPDFFWWLLAYINSPGKIFRMKINVFENLEQANLHTQF